MQTSFFRAKRHVSKKVIKKALMCLAIPRVSGTKLIPYRGLNPHHKSSEIMPYRTLFTQATLSLTACKSLNFIKQDKRTRVSFDIELRTWSKLRVY